MRSPHQVAGIPCVDSTSLLNVKTSRRQSGKQVIACWSRQVFMSPSRQVVTGVEAGVRLTSRQVVAERVCAKNNSVSLLAATPLACLQTACRQPAKRLVVSRERETGLEPATACLEGRNSTTELLPHVLTQRAYLLLQVGVRGLEPRTSWSQTMRATNCATPRYNLNARAI